MGLFGTKKVEEKELATEPMKSQAPGSPGAHAGSQPRAVEPPRASGRVGIEHAIALLRTLPTDKNVDLVITVLKTTLESLGIRVADIVKDASRREHEIQTQVAHLKAEIASFEKEIQHRVQEVARLDAVHAETSKVRAYLESDDIELTDDDARPTVTA